MDVSRGSISSTSDVQHSVCQQIFESDLCGLMSFGPKLIYKHTMLILFYFSYCLLGFSAAQFNSELQISSTAPSSQWVAIAVSSTGQYLIAASSNDGIYTSDNFAYSWVNTEALNAEPLQTVAISQNGSFACTAANSGYIYISKDYGAQWSEAYSTKANWISVASDETGQHLYAVDNSNSGILVYSSNFGVYWTESTTIDEWSAVACSASGQYVAAAVYRGNILISSNYGQDFFTKNFDTFEWTSLAYDYSGQYLVASAKSNEIITVSNNYGDSWTTSDAPTNSWSCVTSSSTGQYMYAVEQVSGSMYYSVNYGLNWNQSATNQALNWYGITTSSTGEYVSAVVNGGGIYSNFYSPTSSPSSQPTDKPTEIALQIPTSLPTAFPVSLEFSTTLVEINSDPLQYLKLVCSSSGQYLYSGTQNAGIIMSNDYGNSISQVLESTFTIIGI